MESWILYHHSRYTAVPWPYRNNWDEFVEAPESLVNPAGGFGQVSPSDGFGEMKSVPAHLPREVPRGRYELAVYHDADFIYAFLDAERAEPVRDLREMPGCRWALGLLAPDSTYYFQFDLDEEGGGTASGMPNVGGSRLTTCRPDGFQWQDVGDQRLIARIPRAIEWHHALRKTDAHFFAGWRIARRSIADLFQGNVLRLSLMSVDCAAAEAVAWGAHLIWHLRTDEVGEVTLVAKRERSPWPVVEQVRLDYDPGKEGGSLRIRWSDLYEAEETLGFEQIYGHRYFTAEQAPKDTVLLRVNADEFLLPLAAESTAQVTLKDGWNFFQIADVGGLPIRFHVEKFGGRRIIESPQPPRPSPPRDRIMSLAVAAAAAHMKKAEARQAEGMARRYISAYTSNTAALGRLYRYGSRADSFLSAIRDEADFTLRLQRDDGTFAGFHMSKSSRTERRWWGGAYDSGRTGELWVMAATLLGDPKYLEASRRLVASYSGYRLEFNHNYAAFGLWHLVAHYRLTQEPLALEHALYYARTSAARGITPCGFQAGHNYYTCYGGVTLRGLANLCAALPPGHPYRDTLRELCVRMGNQLISRLQPEGHFGGRNRMLIALKAWEVGLFNLAFLLEPDEVRRIDIVTQQMLAGYQLQPPGDWNSDVFFLGDLCRYLAYRDTLLAGETVNPFTVL